MHRLRPRGMITLPPRTKVYAGVGSRETPPMFCAGMTAMAAMLRDNGWLLRSGAAQGADEAFEAGAGDAKEIWLPKRGFRGHPSARTPSADAFRLAAMHHPGWRSCSPFARALHARNGHQVLGADLCTPVAFVACWTLDGSGRGGTGQAIRIAHAHEVPVFDLGGDFEAAIGGIAALSGIDADCLLNSFAQPMPIHQKMRFG